MSLPKLTVNVNRFPSLKPALLGGLCSANNKSAGKRLSGKTGKRYPLLRAEANHCSCALLVTCCSANVIFKAWELDYFDQLNHEKLNTLFRKTTNPTRSQSYNSSPGFGPNPFQEGTLFHKYNNV